MCVSRVSLAPSTKGRLWEATSRQVGALCLSRSLVGIRVVSIPTAMAPPSATFTRLTCPLLSIGAMRPHRM